MASNCVEVRIDDRCGLVEVGDTRDDKNDCDRSRLVFTAAQWQAFIDGVKAGEFDLQPIGS